MKKLLQLSKTFLALVAMITCNSFTTQAVQQEDSCKAFIQATTDSFDPLLVHFAFNGITPVGSFQFMGSWDFGDGNISLDSCADHLYSQPGTYLVCFGFSICIGGGLSCHDDTCVSITVGNIAGIANPDGMRHNFYSYPNPVQSKFHLRSDSEKDMDIRIKDVSGRTVFTSVVKNDEAIDAAAFSNGVYFIEALNGTGILKRKMVVQK